MTRNSASPSSCQTGLAPIVMISYNRPELVQLSVRNVALAHAAADHDIFMFIDGPRTEDDVGKQDRINEIVESFQASLPKLKIIRREKNYGCRGNIVDAITQVISRYGKAIIIEDDILVSRTFLDYMDEALEFYKGSKQIWSINAYQHPNLRIPRDYPYDVYLNPVNMCWGWGTWADRWAQVDFELQDWPVMRKDPEMVAKLNRSGRHLYALIDRQYSGDLKTWDVQCAYHVVKNGLMSIEPRYPLSKNIGFSHIVGGEHNKTEMPYLSRQAYYNFRPKLIADLGIDPRLIGQFEWVNHNRNIGVRILRKLQRAMAYFKRRNIEPKEI